MGVANFSVFFIVPIPPKEPGTSKPQKYQQKEYMNIWDGRLLESEGRPVFQKLGFEEMPPLLPSRCQVVA